MRDFLYNVYLSLCKVEVKGKENMDILLGCILAIEQKISEIDAEPDKKEVSNGE